MCWLDIWSALMITEMKGIMKGVFDDFIFRGHTSFLDPLIITHSHHSSLSANELPGPPHIKG